MIKVIKINDLVYQNIEPKTIDEQGNEVWNIPSDFQTLQTCTVDTLNWLIGQEVKKASGGDFTKLSAANSKAIVLLAKAVDSAADKSNFTQKEQEIWDAMLGLAQGGYSDSNLLYQSLVAVITNIQNFSTKIEQAMQASSVDDLIAILENL